MNSPLLIDCIHGSAEWMEARRGLVTASRCADVLALLKKKNDEAAPRKKYRMELAIEILTGQSFPHYVSQEMQWGIDQEPFARAAYEIKRNTGRNLRLLCPSDRRPLWSFARWTGRQ